MANKHRWLVAELRARSFEESDCYYEDSVAVIARSDDDRVGAFYAFWFERQWYLGSCARMGVTYLLPDGGDVVAACVAWAAEWTKTPPEESFGAAAPPEVVAQFRLKQLSRTEISAWFDAMGRSLKRILSRLEGDSEEKKGAKKNRKKER